MPAMPVLQRLLRRVLQQLIEQRQRLAMVQPEDALDSDRIEVDRLVAGVGMRAHQRMQHGIRHTLLRRVGQAHELPRAVAALVDVDCQQGSIRRRVAAGSVSYARVMLANCVSPPRSGSVTACSTVAFGGRVSLE